MKVSLRYINDKAGNIQMSSIAIDAYKDFSAPELTVDGIKKHWVNCTDGWDVHSDSIGAKVYKKEAGSEYNASGMEIGAIVPKTENGNVFETMYSLPEFEKDGVYSVDLTAVNKAGNRSSLCRNTFGLRIYFIMKSPVFCLDGYV